MRMPWSSGLRAVLLLTSEFSLNTGSALEFLGIGVPFPKGSNVGRFRLPFEWDTVTNVTAKCVSLGVSW